MAKTLQILKQLLAALALLVGSLAGSLAQTEAHPAAHAKHNMILFGEGPFYASHLVYKSPHNYQVILEVSLPPVARDAYLAARAAYPAATFIYLLDSMAIAEIQSAASIIGAIQRVAADESRVEIAPSVSLERKDFKILLFDELPLSLEPKTPHH